MVGSVILRHEDPIIPQKSVIFQVSGDTVFMVSVQYFGVLDEPTLRRIGEDRIRSNTTTQNTLVPPEICPALLLFFQLFL